MLAALLGGVVAVRAQTAPPQKQLPGEEMRIQGEQLAKDVEADHRHVLHLQAVARKEKDVIKLTCINDKLVQIAAHLNLFDSNHATLQSSLEGTDADSQAARQTSYDEMTKNAADVKKLRGEADGCAGELEMYKQESKTDVTRPDLDDPTDGEPFHHPEQMGDPDIDPPAYATPYR